MGLIETAVTQWHRFVQRGSNASTPAAGHWNMFFKSNGLNIINSAGVVIPITSPDDLSDWGSWPDSDLNFSTQESGTTFYRVRGDYMRMHETWRLVGGDVGANSSSEMAIIFDDTTDRVMTLANVINGHSLYAKASQISGGTGHKILLPVSCGWNGTSDRAMLFNATTDWAICVAWSATNYEVMMSNGVTFAAS